MDMNMDMSTIHSFSDWLYAGGFQHIAAVAISLAAAAVALKLSRQFGGEIGKALKWFCAGLLVITLPHTLEFFTVTYPSLPIARDPVRLLKTISYIVSVLLFLYAIYRLRRGVRGRANV